VCAKVASFEEAGLDGFFATLFVANTVAEMVEQMRLFARYVLRPSLTCLEPSTCRRPVVGAGPVGLTAAAELRRRSVAVRCVDAAHHHNVSTKALGLQARTSYPYLLMLPQRYDKEILRHRLPRAGHRGRTRRGGGRVTAGSGGVDAVLRHGDGSEHVRADWIGADGARNSIRHQLGLSFEGARFVKSSPQRMCGSTGSYPPTSCSHSLNRRQLYRVLSDGRRRHRVAIAYNTAGPLQRDQARRGRAAIDAFGPIGARARESATDRGSSSTSARSRNSPLAAFSSPATPHVHSVVGAQGLNIGVQDAFNLAWKLAAVISDSAPTELLETYAAERHPAARRIVKGTRRAARMTLIRRRPRYSPAATSRRWYSVGRRSVAPSSALSQLDISYRTPGQAAVADQSVVTGDPRTDSPLRHFGVSAVAQRARHPAVRGDQARRLLALLFGRRQDIAAGLLADPPVTADFRSSAVRGAARRRGVCTTRLGEMKATMLVDVANTLRRKYRIRQRAMLLVRPDGYLALRFDEWSPGALRNPAAALAHSRPINPSGGSMTCTRRHGRRCWHCAAAPAPSSSVKRGTGRYRGAHRMPIP
jgi:2-polyprenyl-6-methoxyphenol hydroxylase-like FAD-dependent oxidoreductase